MGIVKSCNREFNTVESPMIADKDRKVARIYGMLDDTNVNKAGLPLTVRSVFLIDPQKKIRAILTYPATLGRNFNEILRMIQSLQLTDKHKVVTPANWKVPPQRGEREVSQVIINPNVNDQDAKRLFPAGFRADVPYMRFVNDPSRG